MTKGEFHKVKNFTPGIVAGDLAAAMATATFSSCVVSVIDKSIMEKTLGKRAGILEGLMDGWKTMATKPHHFFLKTEPANNYAQVYRLVFLVYSMTYFAGNVTQSYCESTDTPWYIPKFTMGSICNVGLTLYKDNCMLGILPPPGKQSPVPNFSRLLFVIRDSLTVLASFWIAPVVAKKIKRAKPDWTDKNCSDIADIAVPASVQLISTPMHLYAIALKNHPKENLSFLGKIVVRDYLPATAARMCRIIPAFGFGMMINKRIRSASGIAVEGDV